jgi:hypothetical protein
MGRLARKPAGRVVAAGLLLALGQILAGCSSIGDQLPTAVGGLPEGAPKRPATPAAYPAVHDVPPPRATSVLSEQEQQKLEDDLAAAGKRAAGAAKPAAKAATKAESKAAGSAGKP